MSKLGKCDRCKDKDATSITTLNTNFPEESGKKYCDSCDKEVRKEQMEILARRKKEAFTCSKCSSTTKIRTPHVIRGKEKEHQNWCTTCFDNYCQANNIKSENFKANEFKGTTSQRKNNKSPVKAIKLNKPCPHHQDTGLSNDPDFTYLSPVVIAGREEEMKDYCRACVNYYHEKQGGELVANKHHEEISKQIDKQGEKNFWADGWEKKGPLETIKPRSNKILPPTKTPGLAPFLLCCGLGLVVGGLIVWIFLRKGKKEDKE